MNVLMCPGCGLWNADGAAGCRRLFEELMARDFSSAAHFRVHRLMVDTYALQHPDEYCVSPKSMAAHLTGLAWLLNYEPGESATGNEALRRWIEVHPDLPRPTPPAFRGVVTVGEVSGVSDPAEYARAVERWARSTWRAYSALHSLARSWISEAFEAPARRGR